MEPEPKKRKLDSGDAVNGIVHTETQYAKNPSVMVANKHISALHERLKKECQTLAELCVRTKPHICSRETATIIDRTRSNYGLISQCPSEWCRPLQWNHFTHIGFVGSKSMSFSFLDALPLLTVCQAEITSVCWHLLPPDALAYNTLQVFRFKKVCFFLLVPH